MKNPAMLLETAMQPIQGLLKAIDGAVPAPLFHLVHLRTSQINGCSVCVLNSTKSMREVSADKLACVGAWQHSPLFTDAERAALALAESITRLADRSDPVPDAVWAEAARHFDEKTLAGLVLAVGLVNLFNRVNIATAQVAAEWKS